VVIIGLFGDEGYSVEFSNSHGLNEILNMEDSSS